MAVVNVVSLARRIPLPGRSTLPGSSALKATRRECAFDPMHTFTADPSVVPTPSFHSPSCASAAMRQEQRRARVSEAADAGR